MTSVLPSSIAPISRSRSAQQAVDAAARGSPCFSSACMRAREAAVSAVSEPEKSAESRMQTTRIAPATQRLSGRSCRPRRASISRSARNSSSRKARTASGSTFLAMKLSPMPRARMKVSAPRFTFLSWYMASRMSSASAFQPAMSRMRVGRPTARRCASTRSASSAGQRPSAAEKRKAQAMPMATPSPCTSRCAVVADELFERMAEGVAEIEQRAVALLGLVARDDGGLGFAAHRDGVAQLGAACEHRLPVRFEPGEEMRPVDQAVFDDFGIAGGEFARRQGGEAVGVGEHERRLMEGADQILAMRRIDAGLAADARNRPARAGSSESARSACRGAGSPATKPARSPTTPPPSAMRKSPRSIFAASAASQSCS